MSLFAAHTGHHPKRQEFNFGELTQQEIIPSLDGAPCQGYPGETKGLV